MKVLVTFSVSEEQRKIVSEIFGKDDVIWYPDTGKAEIFLIKDNDFPHNQTPKFIQTLSAGTDHIDMDAIPDDTVVASNAGAYSISVAEHCFALLLERTKTICKFREETRRGVFDPEDTKMLYGKTIGIIGYGGIGSRIASISRTLGMNVVAIGRGHRDDKVDKFLPLSELDVLLRESDFIIVSLPVTKKTIGIIGEKELKMMKKDAIMVNVARPEIIKKNDIIRFLKENERVSYLTDVWWQEPDLQGCDLKNVVVTPHIAGGLSGEVMEIAYREAFENIRRYIDHKNPRNIIAREEGIFIERKSIGV